MSNLEAVLVIERRIDHLKRRTDEAKAKGKRLDFDLSEMAALKMAVYCMKKTYGISGNMKLPRRLERIRGGKNGNE